MKKLLALYSTPEDVDAFLAHYNDSHKPLAEKVPGLAKIEVTRITKTLMGEDGNFLLAELYFHGDAFRDAMRSPENGALGQDLDLFAKGRVTVMLGDVTQG